MMERVSLLVRKFRVSYAFGYIPMGEEIWRWCSYQRQGGKVSLVAYVLLPQ